MLVALLRSELVDGLGWLTEQQLLDAVAVGQATPGPLFSTATFIGYLLAGPLGALAATVGIFLPAFLAVGLSIPVLDRLRRSAACSRIPRWRERRRGRPDRDRRRPARDRGDPRRRCRSPSAGAALVLLVRGVGTGRLILAGAVIGLIRLALGSP